MNFSNFNAKRFGMICISEFDESEHVNTKYAYESHSELFANTLQMFLIFNLHIIHVSKVYESENFKTKYVYECHYELFIK